VKIILKSEKLFIFKNLGDKRVYLTKVKVTVDETEIGVHSGTVAALFGRLLAVKILLKTAQVAKGKNMFNMFSQDFFFILKVKHVESEL
jgi:hypothetical protein